MVIHKDRPSSEFPFEYEVRQPSDKRNLFDVSSNDCGSQAQIILRHDDSFTSKQTNEYMQDLILIH